MAADSHADSACDVSVYLYEDCDNTTSSGTRESIDLPEDDLAWTGLVASEREAERQRDQSPDSTAEQERAERREVGSLGEQRRVSMALGIVLNFFPENSRHIPFPNRCRDACGPPML